MPRSGEAPGAASAVDDVMPVELFLPSLEHALGVSGIEVGCCLPAHMLHSTAEHVRLAVIPYLRSLQELMPLGARDGSVSDHLRVCELPTAVRVQVQELLVLEAGTRDAGTCAAEPCVQPRVASSSMTLMVSVARARLAPLIRRAVLLDLTLSDCAGALTRLGLIVAAMRRCRETAFRLFAFRCRRHFWSR